MANWFSPKALVGALVAGAIVVADPDNYGPNGFPWWGNLLIFLSVAAGVYFVWYGALEGENEADSSTKKMWWIAAAGAAMAVLLVVVLVLSLQ